MREFIEVMVANGFPDYHFILSEKRVLRSWSDLMKSDTVEAYLKANGIGPETVNYLTVAELAYDYVERTIPAQFTETDDEGDEYDCWSDETYEMWNQAFVSYVESHCLASYEVHPESFLEKARSIKTKDER